MNSHKNQKICSKEFVEDVIKLDLFKLHDEIKDNLPEKWLVVKGANLQSRLHELIDEIKLQGMTTSNLVKHFMKKHNISITTAERLVYLKKEWFPLIFIKELLNIAGKECSKFTLQEEIDFIKTSQPPLKILTAQKHLSSVLCKIAGAHTADGTIHENFFCITDYYHCNLIAFQKWVKEAFDLDVKLDKISENEWRIRFHNKVFARYLIRFFGFPSGCKQYTVIEPEIVRNASPGFRKAFALGALTFEAGIGMKHQIEFCVVSKDFRDSISEVLQMHNIRHNCMQSPSNSYWRLWSNTLNKDDAIKWLEFFEPKTEKWHKLKDSIYGFSKKVHSFEGAQAILDLVYQKQSSSKIILTDVLLALRELKQACRYEIVSHLINKKNLESYGGKWAHSLKYYLDILRKANIISVERRIFGKKKSFGSIVREVYCFNENISEWRLPERNNYAVDDSSI
jgi:hypothetical protein